MKLNLNRLLRYKNVKVLTQYKKDYPLAILTAEQAFEELMKFVWLAHNHQLEKEKYPINEALDFKCVIHEEMKEIDDMWHTFLLFTKDYHAFCNEYLNGIFFHHEPITNNSYVSEKAFEREMYRYLVHIGDNLGEDTLKKWFNI